MSLPKIGMHFEDVRKRLKTSKSIKVYPELKGSLLNQARLHEGEGAVKELNQEIDSNNHSSNKLGWSSGYGKNWERIWGKK